MSNDQIKPSCGRQKLYKFVKNCDYISKMTIVLITHLSMNGQTKVENELPHSENKISTCPVLSRLCLYADPLIVYRSCYKFYFLSHQIKDYFRSWGVPTEQTKHSKENKPLFNNSMSSASELGLFSSHFWAKYNFRLVLWAALMCGSFCIMACSKYLHSSWWCWSS